MARKPSPRDSLLDRAELTNVAVLDLLDCYYEAYRSGMIHTPYRGSSSLAWTLRSAWFPGSVSTSLVTPVLSEVSESGSVYVRMFSTYAPPRIVCSRRRRHTANRLVANGLSFLVQGHFVLKRRVLHLRSFGQACEGLLTAWIVSRIRAVPKYWGLRSFAHSVGERWYRTWNWPCWELLSGIWRDSGSRKPHWVEYGKACPRRWGCLTYYWSNGFLSFSARKSR